MQSTWPPCRWRKGDTLTPHSQPLPVLCTRPGWHHWGEEDAWLLAVHMGALWGCFPRDPFVCFNGGSTPSRAWGWEWLQQVSVLSAFEGEASAA